jgi:tetratricopeptide (TPR) repeat protein
MWRRMSAPESSPGGQPPAVVVVDTLVAEGRWADAAATARAAGLHARAAELYEKLWDFAAAAECARAAGDAEGELRNLLDAKADDAATALAARLADESAARGALAARVLEARRRPGQAARLQERLGEHAQAARLYARAGAWVDAGRMREALGEDAEAGRLYERAVSEAAEPEIVARAHLALGALHGRRGQHDLAARHLQEAATHAATRAEALRALPTQLAALGLRDAAIAALTRARALDPSLPADVDAFLGQGRAAPGERPARAAGAAADGRLIGGRYRLARLLGAGGSGRVHAARDEQSGKDVAVKLFFAAQARGQEAYDRFVREAKVCGALAHPNIVQVLDFREDLGFFAMELMTGGTLAERMTPRLAAAPLRRAALEVLAGLQAAHARGVVHRDIKPANVFFDARGVAKLGDFGVAHLLDLGQTQTGGLIGTLAYMAPEQITGAPLTFAADLYALGVTLFQALTGRLPLPGPDFVAQHLGETPPPASSVWPDAAPWDALLARLLAKDPEVRAQSLAELAEALAAIDTGGARRVLVLGGAGGAAPRPSEDAAAVSGTFAAVAAPAPEALRSLSGGASTPRYAHEAPLGATSVSTLVRAVDEALSRSVVIERYAESAPDPASLRRLRILGAAHGPHLQRLLSFDPAARAAVYEAPVGETLAARLAHGPLAARAAARLMTELARAIAPIAAAGAAHGAIGAERILLDDEGATTLVVAGLGPLPDPPPAPEGDVRAVLALTFAALGTDSFARAPGLLLGAGARLAALPCTDAAELLLVARRFADEAAHADRVAAHVRALVALAASAPDVTLALTRAATLARAHGLAEDDLRPLLP